MILWYWYVVAIAGLSLYGYITLNVPLMAALAVTAHFLRRFTSSRSRVAAGFAAASVAAAALALLWRESYLPPILTLISLAEKAAMRPSPQYIFKFAWQFLNLWMLAVCAIFLAAAIASRKAPRLLAFASYAVLALAWALQPGQELLASVEGTAEAFYRTERGRTVKLLPPAENTPPFDILILHVCSLSWQDIKDAGADLTPFFSKFDYVFTGFNSVSAYSGPAALRLLKSPCGQMPQTLLYSDSPADCYLMDRLRADGFKTYTVLSHSGNYGDFSADLRKYGHADAPLDMSGLPPYYRMFDGTPIYADDAALHKFWRARVKSGEARAALYYNTAALHSGAHPPGSIRLPDDPAAYRQRLTALTSQFEKFFEEVNSSGRSAMVIFLPEHGAALSGGRMQAKAVRDIPLPPIVTVPAAVKLIGRSFRPKALKPQIIAGPDSLQALAWLIAEFLARSPFTPKGRAPATLAREIPGTDFFSENENASVIAAAPGYAYRCKWKNRGQWSRLPDSAGIPPGTIPSPGDFRHVAAR